MTKSAVGLAYAPPPEGRRRRRRRAVLVVGLVAALAAGWWWRNEIAAARSQAGLLLAQQKCLTFDPPEGQVVYEEDPAHVPGLLARGDYLAAALPGGRSAAVWWPQAVRDYPDAAASAQPATGLTFLHERRTSGGRRVLVGGSAYPDPQRSHRLVVLFRVIDPARWGHPPQPLGEVFVIVASLGDYNPDRPLRLYAGRPDPANASRFTIDYEISGQRGTLQGQVLDRMASGKPRVEIDVSNKPGGPRR